MIQIKIERTCRNKWQWTTNKKGKRNAVWLTAA